MCRTFRAWTVAAALILCLSPSGCSTKLSLQKNLSEADLFARGQQSEQRKKYADAAEAFRLLVERHPNSSLAPQSQFSLASNLMRIRENAEAETAFDDFMRLYPADPKVADALLLKGDLLHQQIMPPGRSQDKTRECITTYKLFLEKENDTPRAQAAALRVKELRAHLLRNEEQVISHLLSRKKFDSAELRAKRAMEEYPDAAPTANLLSMLAKALKQQDKNDEAEKVLKILDEKFHNDGSKRQ